MNSVEDLLSIDLGYYEDIDALKQLKARLKRDQEEKTKELDDFLWGFIPDEDMETEEKSNVPNTEHSTNLNQTSFPWETLKYSKQEQTLRETLNSSSRSSSRVSSRQELASPYRPLFSPMNVSPNPQVMNTQPSVATGEMHHIAESVQDMSFSLYYEWAYSGRVNNEELNARLVQEVIEEPLSHFDPLDKLEILRQSIYQGERFKKVYELQQRGRPMTKQELESCQNAPGKPLTESFFDTIDDESSSSCQFDFSF